jgi:hypothetical protein
VVSSVSFYFIFGSMLDGGFKCKFCEYDFVRVFQRLNHTWHELKVVILIFIQKLPKTFKHKLI